MPSRNTNNWIPWLLLAIVLVGGWMAWPRQHAPLPAPTDHEVPHAPGIDRTPQPLPQVEPEVAQPGTRTGDAPRGAALSTAPDFLPSEAHATIALILRGGPYPHRQDGSVFGNRESRLPRQPRGWYREYTVDTPGLSHRGARRIVTGGNPPREWYYTDDHYDSFRRFDVAGRMR